MFNIRNIGCSVALTALLFTACKPLPKRGAAAAQDRLELAMEQEFLMTRDPALGYIPRERLEIARAYMKNLLLSRGTSFSALNWQERGPNNVAGRTRALFIDRRDNTGNTVFSASVSGGIWKATNFKSTPQWTPVAEQMGSMAVCALAQDPTNPNVMYAGTGEGWFNVDAVRGNGIWKSTDGGANWMKLPSTDSTAQNRSNNFNFVQDLIVTGNGTVFATSRPSRFCNTGGVLRSTDGGTTWTRSIGVVVEGATSCDSAYNYFGADLELASNGDIYATTGFQGSGIANRGRIWRSPAASNGAAGSWIDITPTGTWKRIEIALAPSNPNVIYALLQGTGTGIGAIKKSTNAGASWSDLPLPVWCNQGTTSNDFTNGQAFYDLIVQVDPTNSENVYIGGIDLFRSTNGGAAWTQISQWNQGCSGLPNVHADQHNILFFPGSGSELIAANDGGVYYSSNAGTSWSPRNLGYNITQFYSVDLHPSQPDYFLGGTQDNGTQKFTAPGLNSTTRATGGDGGLAHIDQTDGNLQITAFVFNFYFYSRNGGVSFTKVPGDNEEGFFINPTDLDDANKVLYTSHSADRLGVVTGLASGTPAFNSVELTSLGGRTISAVKVDPTVSGGGTVWVAGFNETASTSPILLKLTAANTLSPNVTVISNPITTPGAYISSIDVDPSNPAHLLVTSSNYGVVSVVESTNGGASWTNIEGNLPDVPVRWGIFIPPSASLDGTTPGGIMVGTEVSVWSKLSNASVWMPETPSLPNVRTDMLRFRRSDNTVAAATHGRGVWTTRLTGLSTGLPSVANTRDFIRYTGTGSNRLFIKVGGLVTPRLQIRIVDASGRLVRSFETRYVDQSIDLTGLASGSYVLKIFGRPNEQYTRQFVK